MPNAEHQYRIYIGKPDGFGVRGEDKTSAQPDYRSPTQCGEDVERGVLAVSSSFAGPSRYPVLKAVSALAILVLFGLSVDNLVPCCGSVIDSTSQSLPTVQHYARATTGSLLEVFQIYPPVLTVTPEGVLEITDGSSNATVDIVNSHRPSCQETLITYSFANSYGAPFIGDYVPPSCKFNRVTWNLTVTSAGRQFDRLGIVYLGDIEVFRTSTAEPTATGIEWTYLKDMTSFLSLLKDDQKIIFDLGNLINDIYTAAFNVTLTAAFFTADDSITPADLILPVSARLSAQNAPSVFTVPDQVASNNLTLPRNVEKAVFTMAATGQIDEEFWWSNVFSSNIDTFPAYGGLYGYSPFREVQLFIDGMLAGVAWPFPVIFTGGIVPGLWRPIVGIDAFDLKEDEIDITPWLPLLCDGNAHNFTVRIAGLTDNGNGSSVLSETVGSYWLVTGKVFVWLDEQTSHTTTGKGPYKVTPTPQFQVASSVGKTSNGTNDTLTYQISAQRSLSFASTINTSSGSKRVSWQQDLSFSNRGQYTDQGNVQVNDQQTSGYDKSSSGYARHFEYPLHVFSAFAEIADNISIVAEVNRGKNIRTAGQPVFPTGLESFAAAEEIHPSYSRFRGASLSTAQNGNATYLANTTSSTSFSFGTTEQDMQFSGLEIGATSSSYQFPAIAGSKELFRRHALAVNGTIVEDSETLIDRAIGHAHHGGTSSGRGFALSQIPGRGQRGPASA